MRDMGRIAVAVVWTGRLVIALAWAVIGVYMCTQSARADNYVAITTTSYHFNQGKDYNANNFGLGVERRYSDTWRGHAGFYRNSLDRTTVYGLASYTPYSLGEWRVGGATGLGTGYNSRFIGVLAGGFAIREWKTFGVNIIVHPAAVALQIKVKFN